MINGGLRKGIRARNLAIAYQGGFVFQELVDTLSRSIDLPREKIEADLKVILAESYVSTENLSLENLRAAVSRYMTKVLLELYEGSIT